ncbi:MAG: cation transporter [Gammaproteobacteria bacterium GWE2_42_36]|nr:MAG: cation transporter [Gammaproteobacteria bacterium GWE2_42_36]
MIAAIIKWSLRNRILILFATMILVFGGIYLARQLPIDAIPDLSDVQVIIKASYPGRAPQIMEDQVTYPLTTTMMSVPGAKTVRGYSFFGDSYVYVLFEDGTDLYWARSRVLEYLNQAAAKLPSDVKLELGPDATGVGWIYEYALIDKTGRYDISQLRSLQDWFLKYELRTVPGIAEVATIGGMTKQYQIVIDPNQLRALRIPLNKIVEAVKNANQESGGSVIELGESEYMVRADGYLKSIQDIESIPIGLGSNGVPILLKDVAHVQLGPEIRRGIAELNGEGEVVGGVLIMRYGKNAETTIQLIKAKLQSLKGSLPKGVEIVPTYDRSGVIERAVSTLKDKLLEESIIVALVCMIFLFHIRSAFVAVIVLPIGILVALMLMQQQGINANIMSLGGIAIAIGAMVDAAIVMIENAHKHFERHQQNSPNQPLTFAKRLELITQSAVEVGPALFFSLLIITLSFTPIFTLQSQEGRLFAPLAFTKTYAMAAAAGLSITLVPVLMLYLMRGTIRAENKNPINHYLMKGYKPALKYALDHPKLILSIALVFLALTFIPFMKLGSEFMPPLNEGDLLYMPTAFPGIAIGKAAQILQQTDKLIASVPEVKSVFGKAGHADTATDPAPLEMFETTIQLKPQSAWRKGMTINQLIRVLNQTVNIPGLVNVWVQPIRNRIDMLATGIKSPVGIKVSGPHLEVLEDIGEQIETLVKTIPGTVSAYAERPLAGRYMNIHINREQAARYALNISDVQDMVRMAIGGDNISETVEGLERYPINLRFDRDWRDSLQKLNDIPILSPTGAVIPLSSVAEIKIVDGPAMLKSENARLTNWVYVDMSGKDLGTYVKEAKRLVAEKIQLPPGYSIEWSGQYEYLERAVKRMEFIVPLTLVIILWLLFTVFRNFNEALLIMVTLPFSLIGGFWLTYLLGFNLSVAVAIGFIALAGVATEFGVVMLVYLDQAVNDSQKSGQLMTYSDLQQAIIRGAVQRLRPKTMTVAIIIAGLLPVMLGHGTGSEIMRRIAAPMIGGMITAPLLSLFIVPIIYLMLQKKALKISAKSRQVG